MIRDELRGPRDVLRARLRMVTRRSSAKNSLDRLLEKWNVARVEDLPPLYQVQAAAQTALISVLTDQIHTLEVAVQPTLLESTAVQRLLWIPGIGRLMAFTIYLEVGDIQRFPTINHFWSYCRLVPGAADSADRHRHRRSKDGNRYLKLAFSHAAVRAVQYFPEVRQRYLRWKRKKPLGVARARVAKELAQSVYHVLKDDVNFKPAVQGHAAHAAEDSAVAPSGEPLRLTELGVELLCLIGRPDGMPGSRSGTRPLTARAAPHRAAR